MDIKAESFNPHAGDDNEDISLRTIVIKTIAWFKFLLSKWAIILVFIIVGGSLGLIYSYLKKPTYTAVTSFVLEDDKGSSLGNLGGLASMVGVDLGGSGGGIFKGDNILELYKSRAMIEKALLSEIDFKGKKELLIDRYLEFNDLRANWAKKPELNHITFSTFKEEQLNREKAPFLDRVQRLKDSVMGKVVEDINKNYLTVSKPDKKLSIIKAEVKSKDEFFAKVFNEQIVKNVNDFYVQTKTKKSVDNVAILQRKTDSVRTVMTGAVYSAAAVSDATPNLNPTRLVQRVAPVQKSQITIETNKAVLSTLLQNLEMAKYTQTKEAPLIQVVDVPVYPLPVNEFGRLICIVAGAMIFGILIVLLQTVKYIIND